MTETTERFECEVNILAPEKEKLNLMEVKND